MMRRRSLMGIAIAALSCGCSIDVGQSGQTTSFGWAASLPIERRRAQVLRAVMGFGWVVEQDRLGLVVVADEPNRVAITYDTRGFTMVVVSGPAESSAIEHLREAIIAQGSA